VFVLTKLGRAMKALGSDDPMTMTKQ
jgi:hypothetical protein